jgi:putative ABC transport system permease protein
MKRSWFLLFLMKSISRRKGRVIIASISVTLAVAVVTGMIGITVGISEKLGSELKAYGANIIVLPRNRDYLNYDVLDSISKINHVNDAAGQVFGSAFINRQVIEIIGLDVSRLKDKGWRLYGNWPEKKDEILAGSNLKNALKLEKGETISLEGEGKKINFIVSGFIEKGGSEDSSLIMAISDAWELMGLNGKVSAVLVRGKSGEIDSIVKSIKNTIPTATVKTFRQVAVAEESLLNKIQLLMALVTVVVLFASCISVASTMGANVLERREEIGLMKAIGATRNEISIFYRAEAILIGLLGGFAGFVLGYLSAQAISTGAFKSFITMPFYISFLSLIIGLVISVLSSHFPVRDAMKFNPAVILRGE